MKLSLFRRLLALSFWAFWGVAGAIEIETRFEASHARYSLSGTLLLPDEGLVAAAVLLPVSGPVERDMRIGPHRFMRELAEMLAQHGVATLRYDARGVGQSQGDLFDTGLQERSHDACRALRHLLDKLPVPNLKIGFIGLSEGGGLGLMASTSCPYSLFNVLLSTPLRDGRTVMRTQMHKLLAGSGMPAPEAERIEQTFAQFLSLAGADDPRPQREALAELLGGELGGLLLPPYEFVPQTPQGKADFVLGPWFQSQLRYDFGPLLAASPDPVLVIYGGKDPMLDIVANAQLVRELNPRAKLYHMPEMNHLMQASNTGSAHEYAVLKTGFSPEVGSLVGQWVESLVSQ